MSGSIIKAVTNNMTMCTDKSGVKLFRLSAHQNNMTIVRLLKNAVSKNDKAFCEKLSAEMLDYKVNNELCSVMAKETAVCPVKLFKLICAEQSWALSEQAQYSKVFIDNDCDEGVEITDDEFLFLYNAMPFLKDNGVIKKAVCESRDSTYMMCNTLSPDWGFRESYPFNAAICGISLLAHRPIKHQLAFTRRDPLISAYLQYFSNEGMWLENVFMGSNLIGNVLTPKSEGKATAVLPGLELELSEIKSHYMFQSLHKLMSIYPPLSNCVSSACLVLSEEGIEFTKGIDDAVSDGFSSMFADIEKCTSLTDVFLMAASAKKRDDIDVSVRVAMDSLKLVNASKYSTAKITSIEKVISAVAEISLSKRLILKADNLLRASNVAPDFKIIWGRYEAMQYILEKDSILSRFSGYFYDKQKHSAMSTDCVFDKNLAGFEKAVEMLLSNIDDFSDDDLSEVSQTVLSRLPTQNVRRILRTVSERSDFIVETLINHSNIVFCNTTADMVPDIVVSELEKLLIEIDALNPALIAEAIRSPKCIANAALWIDDKVKRNIINKTAKAAVEMTPQTPVIEWQQRRL